MNIAILDDIQADRDKASFCLHAYFTRHPAIGTVHFQEFVSGEAFLQAFAPGLFQCILIDYYMDGISGMETARQIRKYDDKAILIFITTSHDYAIEGYKVKASGYLTKPFDYDALEEIMTLIDMNKIRDNEFIELDTGNRTVRILLNDIIYCDIAGHYVQVYTESAGLRKFRMSFFQLTEMLRPFDEFLPCYRGCIVNMNKITKIDQCDFLMDNGVRIPFRKKEQGLVTATYTDFLFDKVRRTQH